MESSSGFDARVSAVSIEYREHQLRALMQIARLYNRTSDELYFRDLLLKLWDGKEISSFKV